MRFPFLIRIVAVLGRTVIVGLDTDTRDLSANDSKASAGFKA